MGFGGISVWQLLIVLAIVVLIFGTKKLRGMGGDLGGAIKNFKSAVNEEKAESKEQITESSESASSDSGETIDVKAKEKNES